MGIIEVISLLLGLQGFGVQANPKAPTVDAALQYAIPDADVVGFVDAASLIPGNYKVLQDLPNQPQIKASPDLAKMVRQMIAEVEGPRGLAKSMTGIDLVTDVSDVTASFQYVSKNADPKFVLAVHGKFSATTIDKVGKMTGKGVMKAGGGAWVDMDDKAVAVTKDGVLLIGTKMLVSDRVQDAWKAPGHGAGTSLAAAADVLAAKPVFAFVVTMSQTMRSDILMEMKGQNFATDMIKRHKLATFAVFHDGIGWTWGDSSATGLDAMAQLSDGVVDLLRAAQIAPRGFAKIAMGALESYRGINKQIDQVITHKGDIMKLVDAYSGDGNFKVKIDKDAKAMKLNVRLTGKSVSEVLPLGGFVPFAAFGFLMLRGEAREHDQAPAVMVAPPPPPPPPAKAPPKKK